MFVEKYSGFLGIWNLQENCNWKLLQELLFVSFKISIQCHTQYILIQVFFKDVVLKLQWKCVKSYTGLLTITIGHIFFINSASDCVERSGTFDSILVNNSRLVNVVNLGVQVMLEDRTIMVRGHLERCQFQWQTNLYCALFQMLDVSLLCRPLLESFKSGQFKLPEDRFDAIRMKHSGGF